VENLKDEVYLNGNRHGLRMKIAEQLYSPEEGRFYRFK
jgi:hypothetical protein